MRSGRTIFLKIAFVLSSAAASPCLLAADSAPAAPASAPEKIEFSRSSSTAPRVPRPGEKNEDLTKRFGNVRERMPGPETEFHAPMLPTTAVPSRAAAEKMLQEWDKKKNWLVPGAQDLDPNDPLADMEKAEKDWTHSEKSETVMERYLNGHDKKKNTGQDRERDVNDPRRRDGRANGDRETSSTGRDGKNKEDSDRRRDGSDNADANDFAAFNLKNFIRQQNGQQPFVKDNLMPKASQLFRSDFAGRMESRDEERQRAQTKERDAARSAEFMQMLKPRGSGPYIGASDPINSPDLSRREMNPIRPGATERSTLGHSPFDTAPSSPASRIQENNMFGVTGPAAASSMAPSINTPLPRPEAGRMKPINIEPPRRLGF